MMFHGWKKIFFVKNESINEIHIEITKLEAVSYFTLVKNVQASDLWHRFLAFSQRLCSHFIDFCGRSKTSVCRAKKGSTFRGHPA